MRHISIKRIYAPPEPQDDMRILVDRLWPRGVSKEEAQLDYWSKETAPSPALRKWFDHDPARFDEFRQHYRAELEAMPAVISHIADLARNHDLTLLYAAKDPQINHAIILAEYLRQKCVEQDAAGLSS